VKFIYNLVRYPIRIFLAHQEISITISISQLITGGILVVFFIPWDSLIDNNSVRIFSETIADFGLLCISFFLTYPFVNVCLKAHHKKLDIIHVYWFSLRQFVVLLLGSIIFGLIVYNVVPHFGTKNSLILLGILFYSFNLIHTIAFFYLPSDTISDLETTKTILTSIIKIVILQSIQCVIFLVFIILGAIPLFLGWLFVLPLTVYSNFIIFKHVSGKLEYWESEIEKHSSVDLSL
jgi:hypothetical protein